MLQALSTTNRKRSSYRNIYSNHYNADIALKCDQKL